jgi:hypothetical protein
MRNTELSVITTCRLTKLALHLEWGSNLIEYKPIPDWGSDTTPMFKIKNGLIIIYYEYIMREFPYIFHEQWGWNKKGLPILKYNPSMDVINATLDFFELGPSEFMQLFVPFAQDPKYGKNVLKHDASPIDIATNIYDFVGNIIFPN